MVSLAPTAGNFLSVIVLVQIVFTKEISLFRIPFECRFIH